MTPLYRKIADDLIERIVSGALPPGFMLPSETEIGEEYGASQGTARKALSELEQRGILERKQGRGTFVAQSTDEKSLYHFFRLRDADGNQIVPQPDSEQIIRRTATQAEASILFGVPVDVFEITRIRLINGKRRAHETIILPVPLFPGLDERGTLANALYPFYQRVYGVAVIEADESLTPYAAGAQEAVELELKMGTPMLAVDRVARDIQGRVVELRKSRYATDNLHYAITLR
ncbi:GntR family transcriptional regulator [Parasulfitobacter algicola]|uniref:GntR family transcriptional regulator n=1 Tax=Parasulfitobacter algicola TaxID=2614809 RepID=A0ABX2J0A1_9RHOB|nr:GntR family transcriptional regulator [Sulfitobacter algicola]NSX56153.1 GntR family transcriptional regulator [Sulfitobacter algicola]